MFRKPGKNEKEVTTPLYPQETGPVSSYKYGAKKTAEMPQNEEMNPPRFFDQQLEKEEKRSSSLPHHFQNVIKEEPETTLGEGVTFRGELTFERLLRIDGTFEGELISQGKVIVGPRGKVKANLSLREAIVEGKVEGNITVEERLELRGEACVNGDITAKLLSVDEGVSICGHVNVTPSKDDPS
jgi:cytoskeletal protein CcmA (bactofilin family)